MNAGVKRQHVGEYYSDVLVASSGRSVCLNTADFAKGCFMLRNRPVMGSSLPSTCLRRAFAAYQQLSSGIRSAE
jgi:hypothetical protein